MTSPLYQEGVAKKFMGFGSKVGFCPYTWPYPPFLAIAPWPFLGSVAGASTARSLLIHKEVYQILMKCRQKLLKRGPARQLLLEPKHGANRARTSASSLNFFDRPNIRDGFSCRPYRGSVRTFHQDPSIPRSHLHLQARVLFGQPDSPLAAHLLTCRCL